jgi:Tol biopolymer transport system component
VLSPDGKRATGRNNLSEAPGDIWTLDLTREVVTRFTFRQSPGSFPVWSADGSRIAFSAGKFVELRDTIFDKASSGASEEKELYKKPGEPMLPTSWSRDGRFLLYTEVHTPNTRNDVWVLPLEGDRKPVLLLGTQFAEDLGTFSPDGRWIAYVSNESGRTEIYVRPFVTPGPSGTPALGERKWQISRNGGTEPHWHADGKEIFFEENGTMFAVDINTTGSTLDPGVPQRLFREPNAGWDVTADGKRFLMAVPPV